MQIGKPEHIYVGIPKPQRAPALTPVAAPERVAVPVTPRAQ